MKVIIKVLCITLVVACAATLSHAAEGGYSNYIPGTYGDFAVAVEPPTKFTVRNIYIITRPTAAVHSAQAS